MVAAGNFSLMAALLLRFAVEAAPPRRVGGDRLGERDQARCAERHGAELAERLAEVRRPLVPVPLASVHGAPEARGATIGGTQVHSVRLPSFVVSTEVLFAGTGERLTLRHDAGDSPAPYVAGTLLAIRAVPGLVGLTRGLDRLLPD